MCSKPLTVDFVINLMKRPRDDLGTTFDSHCSKLIIAGGVRQDGPPEQNHETLYNDLMILDETGV